MRQVNRIDADGFFIEPIVVEDNEVLTETVIGEDGITTVQPRRDIVETPVPEGFHHARWLYDEWVEGLTQAEIDDRLSAPQPETDAQKIVRLEAENATFKARQAATEQAAADTSLTQQEMLEILIDRGVI